MFLYPEITPEFTILHIQDKVIDNQISSGLLHQTLLDMTTKLEHDLYIELINVPELCDSAIGALMVVGSIINKLGYSLYISNPNKYILNRFLQTGLTNLVKITYRSYNYTIFLPLELKADLNEDFINIAFQNIFQLPVQQTSNMIN